MKQHITRLSRLSDYLVALVLVLVPFHAFLTVWGSSLVGHYTVLRLWDDVALLLLLGICSYWLIKDVSLRRWFSGNLLVRLFIAYAGLQILLGVVALVKGEVVPRALAYGLLIDLRFLAWFLAVVLVAQRSAWLQRSWLRLVVVPAAVVVVFAALQYMVLPHNFLSHFGYDAKTTIAPIETINHNNHYIRVQSTLRGANPFGAYLVLVLSTLGALFLAGRRRIVCGVLGVVALFALYASGSRSGWIGAVIALGLVVWLSLRSRRSRIIFGGAGLALLVVAASSLLLLRSHPAVQNAILHTQDHSQVKISSNDAHASAFTTNVKDVLEQPLGDGPGTAGPASEYNVGHPARIAENYYVQIAQEAGWLGLALFLSMVVLVAVELYRQHTKSLLALVLFASLIGISVVNVLAHAWADDTLAFLWWGLAGVAIGSGVRKDKV